ncbi:MAG: phosphatidylglycerophosphatase A, partial [Phycisphaerales bacterium]|nr:phosphatidylglycerophosphatase A [Phycisphaerales bacterium]
LITTFGLGLLRPAPGTWGSLPPCALAAAWAVAGRARGLGSVGNALWYTVMVFMALYFSWVCVKFGDRAEAEFGRKDPSQVVADETAGMAVTLLFMPHAWLIVPGATLQQSLTRTMFAQLAAIALAFVLFRIADILKLPPANGLQRFKGGWGILLDDLVAGVQAGVVLLTAVYLWRRYV